MRVEYTGTSDFQEFSAADFKKADIEGAKALRFARGVPQEVPDSVGEALTSDEGLFARHSFDRVEEPEKDKPDEDSNDDKPDEEGKSGEEDKKSKKAKKTAQSSGSGGSGSPAGEMT